MIKLNHWVFLEEVQYTGTKKWTIARLRMLTFKSSPPGFKPQLCRLSAIQSWTNYSISLCLSFLIFNRFIVVPISQGCGEIKQASLCTMYSDLVHILIFESITGVGVM